MAREHKELRIRGIETNLKNELINISKNSGVSLSHLLKPVLQEFADKQPADRKKKYEE